MTPMTEYSLSEPASAAWRRLDGQRSPVLETARQLAEITVPSLFPPEGYRAGDRLKTPNQSVNARCINTLASRLMMTAFPPGEPFIRHEIVEHRLSDEEKQDQDLLTKLDLALSRREQAIRGRIETSPIRSVYAESMRQLLLSGNVCWQHIKFDEPVYHRMDKYVVKRDGRGAVLYVILREEASWGTLDPDIREAALRLDKDLAEKDEKDRKVEVFSVCKRRMKDDGSFSWLYWQEVADERVGDTEAESPEEAPPLVAGWMVPMFGEDWGRSYAEEYRGDLFIVDNYHAAITDGASASAFSLLFVKPGAQTNIRDIKKADNLDVLVGSAEDVTMLRANKASDYQFVVESVLNAERRLGAAFLLNSAVQRRGERVTAEEVRILADELDQALGGLYTGLAQGFQRAVILRAIWLLTQEDKQFPGLPPKVVNVKVTTGVDALGRTQEAGALVDYVETLAKLLGPQEVSSLIDGRGFATRLAAARGIQPKGLIKAEEAVAEEAEAAQQNAVSGQVLPSAAKEAVRAVAGAVGQPGGPEALAGMMEQMQQPQQ